MSQPCSIAFRPNALTNYPENAGQVAQYFFIPKPHHLQPSSFEFRSALSIIRSSIWRVVNAAVKFNHQAGFSAVKISDVPTKRFLTQETQPLEFSTAQCPPQHRLSRGRVFAVLPLQLEQVEGFFHGVWLLDCSGWRLWPSHPAAARRPSLVSRKRAKTCAARLPSLAGERSAQAREVLFSGQDRVGDESGVPINAFSRSRSQ